MADALDRLADRPLQGDGLLTRRFRAVGAADFAGAARHVLRLPYGRITERSRFWLVLDEGRARAPPSTPWSPSWPASRASTSSLRSRSTR